MSDCFIGYRLRQRLNEMEGRLTQPARDPLDKSQTRKMIADAKKCLTSRSASPTSVDIGGDVAGPQPTGQEPKET